MLTGCISPPYPLSRTSRPATLPFAHERKGSSGFLFLMACFSGIALPFEAIEQTTGQEVNLGHERRGGSCAGIGSIILLREPRGQNGAVFR